MVMALYISRWMVPEEKIERYGIIGGEEVENGVININQLVEKPPRSVAPSNLAIMGRYFLTPDIFDHIENVEPGYGGEIQLTDALAKLDGIYGKVFVGESYDIGNRMDWLKTSLKFAMEDENSREDDCTNAVTYRSITKHGWSCHEHITQSIAKNIYCNKTTEQADALIFI